MNNKFQEWYDSQKESRKSLYGYGYTISEREKMEESWNACKEECLKILKENWTGLDMSPNFCDKYYIEKIERLL